MTVSKHRSRARAETTKRLLAQLVNEGLVTLSLLDDPKRCHPHEARITGQGNTPRWITLPVVDGLEATKLLRPNDLGLPLTLFSGDDSVTEDDPGSIFEFTTAWFHCEETTKRLMAQELRNSAIMLEKWMELASSSPTLDINSSFLDWERCLITGHPTHPFHRTCFAHRLLEPVGPDDLPHMLNPDLSFVAISPSSVRLFGPFDKLMQPLMSILEIPIPTNIEKITVVPCLSQHLPALLHFFPEASLIRTVPNCAVAQAAIRTVSVPGYAYDLKLSLACLITSALRVLPSWSAAAAPTMTNLLKKVVPPDLWLFGEVAAITGSQEDTSEARYITCILRENLEAKAIQHDEALILASALMERPMGGHQTYAEILFDLQTTSDKLRWFGRYAHCLLRLALDPLRRYGVGFEFHAQNAVLRVCRKTKAIKGFAIRDLAGVKLHGPTLEAQGFDLANLETTSTHEIHEVWARVHHSLLQNHIGYMLYSLGLEGGHDGWGIVRSSLYHVLAAEGDSRGRDIYQYLVKETMPFKSFIKIRMDASFKTSFKIVEQEVPNVLWKKSPWLSQISLAATVSDEALLSPEQVDPETRKKERDSLQRNLVKVVTPYGQVPSVAVARQLNAHPAVLPAKFLENLQLFHEALAPAVDNIIERWWKDKEADFPGRMPLEPRVEALLRWIDEGADEGFMRTYKGNQGNLRPDILIPAHNGIEFPQFRICEINGRFPISFLHYTATAYEALAGMTWHSPSIRPATDHSSLFDSLFRLFNPSVPIHFVGETSDFPPASPLFGLVEQRTGMRPRSVKPSALRLVPDGASPTGFRLYCLWGADPSVTKRPLELVEVEGELLEEVHQVGLQLHDFELFSLAPEMVRHIAMCSVNDPRSVFIAHDKRILAIIRQELDALVYKHAVLTPVQAQLLREGIVPTILPASPELKKLLETARKDPSIKGGFILKPFRQARGSGIVLGKDLSASEWCSILESMLRVDFRSSTTQYLLQPLLPLQSVDWFWDEERKVRKSRMVGAYFSVNGRFVGLGMWRTATASDNIISASTKDVTPVFSVVYLKDDY